MIRGRPLDQRTQDIAVLSLDDCLFKAIQRFFDGEMRCAFIYREARPAGQTSVAAGDNRGA